MEDFTEFVRAEGTQLLRVAYLLTGHEHDAEDLTQTVLARLSTRWSRVSAMDDPHAYARTALLNTWRSWRRRRWWGERPMPVLPDRAGGDLTERFDTYDVLLHALRALPPRQRSVVVLRYYEDLSEEQTARALQCSVGTVKSSASRGLAALRSVVAAHGINSFAMPSSDRRETSDHDR